MSTKYFDMAVKYVPANDKKLLVDVLCNRSDARQGSGDFEGALEDAKNVTKFSPDLLKVCMTLLVCSFLYLRFFYSQTLSTNTSPGLRKPSPMLQEAGSTVSRAISSRWPVQSTQRCAVDFLCFIRYESTSHGPCEFGWLCLMFFIYLTCTALFCVRLCVLEFYVSAASTLNLTWYVPYYGIHAYWYMLMNKPYRHYWHMGSSQWWGTNDA